MAIEEYTEFEPATIDDDYYRQPFENTLDIDYTKSDSFINPSENLGLISKASLGALGAYGTYKGLKTAASRGVDTFGFGNVPGSYKSPSKIAQYMNNLFQASGANIAKMPVELIKSAFASGNPVELKAAESSIQMLENHMSTLRSQGRGVPKNIKDTYLNLVDNLPERRMASAIKEKIFKNRINFKHGGVFIDNTKPQLHDLDVAKALQNKGFSLKSAYPVLDVSEDKFMIKKLRAASTGDPRLRLITNALKDNNISLAMSYARNGSVKVGNRIVDTGNPITLIKEGNGYVAKYVPHYTRGRGILNPVKEYVLGGHTQRTHFRPFKKGFHKTITDGFDITSYASAGEKSSGLLHKARIALAGEFPRKLGVHRGAVVTEFRYKHKMGVGRKKGSKTKTYGKSRNLPAATVKPYTKTDVPRKQFQDKAKLDKLKEKIKPRKGWNKPKKMSKAAKIALKALKLITTKRI
tara:strand:- start:111 stop:1508 length:1398 start_codon:yes stop_codon:yes gene_type:complete